MKQPLYLYTDLFALTKLIKTFKSVNPRTYTQIYTPTVIQGVGEGFMKPLPRVFDMLQYFESILPSVKSLAPDLLSKVRDILWVVALLEACEGTNNCRILAAILDFPKN